MRKLTLISIAAAMLAASAMAFDGGTPKVMPGAKAPSMKYSKWVKGTPITSFAPGKVYVVEFWATWCGPCKTSIPHLTELAHKYKGKVDFIGYSVWENARPDATIEAQVAKFMAEMGDKMDYNVALDADNHMAENWMRDAAQLGIPAAFIIKDQKVMWVGHPMSMDEPLAQVVDGTFDLEASKTAFLKEAADNMAYLEAMGEINSYSAMYGEGYKSAALLGLYGVADKSPQAAPSAYSTILSLRAGSSPDLVLWEVDRILAKGSHGQSAVAMYAVGAAQKPETRDLGKAIANKILPTAEDPITIYYVAMAFQMATDFPAAKAAYEKAIAQLDKDQYKEMAAQLRPAFEAALSEVNKKITAGP